MQEQAERQLLPGNGRGRSKGKGKGKGRGGRGRGRGQQKVPADQAEAGNTSTAEAEAEAEAKPSAEPANTESPATATSHTAPGHHEKPTKKRKVNNGSSQPSIPDIATETNGEKNNMNDGEDTKKDDREDDGKIEGKDSEMQPHDDDDVDAEADEETKPKKEHKCWGSHAKHQAAKVQRREKAKEGLEVIKKCGVPVLEEAVKGDFDRLILNCMCWYS